MSGPDGQRSQVIGDELSLNHTDGSSGFMDLHPDTSTYFDAWLESIQPKLTSEVSAVPETQSRPAPGEFRFEGTLRVDCYVTGRLRTRTGTLLVTETGEVDTDLSVPVAIIDGLVRGDIRATERVDLGSTARVIGNIETPSLSIQPGAVFEGRCHFVPAANAVNQPALRSTDAPRLSVVRSRAVAPGLIEEEEAGPRVAAAGR